MDTSRKICSVLTPDDLSAANLKTTVKTIEHNQNKFYLLDGTQSLWEVVEHLSKASSDDNLVTRMRIAYNLSFELPTELKTGDDLSAAGNVVKTFADLLELLEFDENLNLNRADYHVIINDDNYRHENAEPANRAVAKLFQQAILLSITGLDIQKKSEIHKAQVTRRFREHYDELKEEIEKNEKLIRLKLSINPNLNAESKARAESILASFDDMLAEFKKAKGRPIRIAAMGTKKAGKSVVINSLLQRDYAPTSAVLPTPNTIKYLPDDVSRLVLDYADESREFNTAEELKKYVEGLPSNVTMLVLEYADKHDEFDTVAELKKHIQNLPDDVTRSVLYYATKHHEFDTAEELKKYIYEEFKRAQKGSDEEAALPDMTIHYPCPGLKNRYEIWDTPGPNYAGAGDSHRKNANRCIAEADVCIFVMNYSNYLTDDEVKFLKDIHKTFQENNKFYSLLITVNRIDERYPVPEAKSVDRILDYINFKLEQFKPPYKNIVIFGTSALQHFYLDDVVKLAEAEGLTVEKESMPSLKRKHREAMTQIKFIDDAIGNLQDFHDIENPTDKELRTLSGIPQLWQYAQYIGGSKADMEIVDHVVTICDNSFAKINNDLLPYIVKDFFNLSEKDRKDLEEFAALISGLKRYVENAVADVRKRIAAYSVDEALSVVSKILRDRRRRAKDDAAARGKNILDNASFTEGDVKAIVNNRYAQPQSMRDFVEKVKRMILGINVDSVNGLSPIQKTSCDKYIVEVENTIRAAQEKIYQQTEAVRAKVEVENSNDTVKGILGNFKTPDFPPAIDRLNAEARQINMGLTISTITDAALDAASTRIEAYWENVQKTGTRIVTREREAQGLWESFRSFFGKTYYHDVQENYTYTEREKRYRQVSYYDVNKFKRSIAHGIQEMITTAIEDAHDKMDDAIKDNIRRIFKNVAEQSEQICNGYNNVYASFERDVNMAAGKTKAHKEALEADIKELTDIANKLQRFIDLWNEILHGDAKR